MIAAYCLALRALPREYPPLPLWYYTLVPNMQLGQPWSDLKALTLTRADYHTAEASFNILRASWPCPSCAI